MVLPTPVPTPPSIALARQLGLQDYYLNIKPNTWAKTLSQTAYSGQGYLLHPDGGTEPPPPHAVLLYWGFFKQQIQLPHDAAAQQWLSRFMLSRTNLVEDLKEVSLTESLAHARLGYQPLMVVKTARPQNVIVALVFPLPFWKKFCTATQALQSA